MKFNSDSDDQDVVSTILDKAEATTNVYPLKRITRNFNAALDMYFGWAFEADGRWNFDDLGQSSPPIETQNIVSGTNRYKISDFTSDIIDVLRVEVLTPAGKGRYVEPETLGRLEEVVNPTNTSGRVSNYVADTFQDLYLDANSGTPTHYIKYGNFIYLRPKPDYNETDGLKIYFHRPAIYMASTDTTDTPGVPVTHHPILCELAANMFKYDKKMISFEERVQYENYAKRVVQDHFANRSKDIKRGFTPRVENTR
jgi:hypothetical protein